MSNKTYWEKLKDPRWQKLRLEVMQKNDFQCQICFDKESTLNVHHKEYFKGHEPWDYDSNQLIVMCENCHKYHHDNPDVFKKVSSYLDYDGPKGKDAIAFIISGYCGFDYKETINNSDYEDCAWSMAFYDLGIKLSKIDLDLKKYIKMYEVK